MNENLHIQREMDDKPGEDCGVFGIYDFDGNDIAQTIYYGLFALQHRGQESCGIAVSDTEGPKGKVDSCKGMGLVNEVFDAEKLENLHGNIGVGHVRYSTAGVKFCAECGRANEPVPEPEEWDCSCGHHNLAGVKFCAECGKKRN